ncbi:GvpL/GvpF family gas vesicle protein [Pirellulaceae bacterium SH449]
MNEALYLLGFSPKLNGCSERTKSSLQILNDSGEPANAPCYDPHTLMLCELFEIEQLKVGPTIAWYRRIDRTDFEGEAGEKNLADINWLTPRVMAHEEAVSQLSSQSAFFPSRFGTLFSSESSLYGFTQSATPQLLEFFGRIGGKREWGLKFFGDTAHAAKLIASRDGLIQDGSPMRGANYLRFKQLQRELTRSQSQFFVEAMEQAIGSVTESFPEHVIRPIRSVTKNEGHDELVGNLAVLVSDLFSDSLAAWIKAWNESSFQTTALRAELTGPWPAYSFCPSLSSPSKSDSERAVA